VPLRSIVAGIEAVEIIPGRCEVLDEGQDFSVIVDAASTPQVGCVFVITFNNQEALR
jgi:UDP-N-acetylmuramyl tripeptide synthase